MFARCRWVHEVEDCDELRAGGGCVDVGLEGGREGGREVA